MERILQSMQNFFIQEISFFLIILMRDLDPYRHLGHILTSYKATLIKLIIYPPEKSLMIVC